MPEVRLHISDETLALANKVTRHDRYTDVDECLNSLLRYAVEEFGENLDPARAEIKRLNNLIEQQDATIRALKSMFGEAVAEAVETAREHRFLTGGGLSPRHRPYSRNADRVMVEDPGGGVWPEGYADLDDDIPF